MSLNYDEILADNYFGQTIVVAAGSNKNPSNSMSKTNDIMTNKKESSSLMEQFGFSVDDLFNMARHFLKGNFY